MLADYLGILVLMVVAGAVASAMVGLSWLLGPKKRTPYKQSAYECGVEPVGDARRRFPIQFYLVAIIFVLFDIEVVFLWSWMSVYRTADRAFKEFTFVEFATYMVSWVLAYLYVIRVGALEWDDARALEPAKLGGAEPRASEAA